MFHSMMCVFVCLSVILLCAPVYLTNFFFVELKSLHENTGAKFTLYVYEESQDYNIVDFTSQFSDELKSNSDWLKFGYHAKTPNFVKDSVASIRYFEKSYCCVDSCITHNFGNAKSSILRLHCFFDTPEETEFLRNKGVKCLLSADDDRNSYSLSSEQNQVIKEKGSLDYNGMSFVRTDIRVERDWILLELFRHIDDDEIVLFTHEWAFEGMTKIKFDLLMYFLSLSDCRFIN